jgi:hypothetical protein
MPVCAMMDSAASMVAASTRDWVGYRSSADWVRALTSVPKSSELAMAAAMRAMDRVDSALLLARVGRSLERVSRSVVGVAVPRAAAGVEVSVASARAAVRLRRFMMMFLSWL